MKGTIPPELLTTASLLMAVMGALQAQASTLINSAIDEPIPLANKDKPRSRLTRVLWERAIPLELLGFSLVAIMTPDAISTLISACANIGGPLIPTDAAFLIVYLLFLYFAGMSTGQLIKLIRHRRDFKA